MEKSVQLMDEGAVMRALTRLSFEIMEKSAEPEKIILVGIKTRGVPMARILARKIAEHGGPDVPVCELDITFYRDDLSKKSESPVVHEPHFDVDVTDKTVILVDDVIYTGRTIRAAIEAVFSLGRPAKIGLCVLIDRGHRELPIKADYVGKNVPTSKKEFIKVSFPEPDGETGAELFKKEEA